MKRKGIEEKELTKAEYMRLVQTAKQKGNERLNLLIQTICGTGIRVSELQYITVEAVKCGKAVVSLKGKTRSVFLVRDLQKKLLRYAAEQKITTGAIFITRNGKPMSRTNIWREMKALCKKDLVLGYHSEAESHKFSFDSLAKREKDLKKLLKEVFPRMRKKSYVPTLPEGCFTRGIQARSGEVVQMQSFSFSVKKAGSDLEVTVRIPDSVVSENAISERLEIQLCDKLGTCYPIQRAFDREGRKFNSAAFTSLEMFKEKDCWGAVAKIPLAELVSCKEIAFDVRFQRMEKGVLFIESWADPENKAKRNYAMDVKVAFMGSLAL